MLEKRELLKGIYFTLIITLKIKGRRENRLEWDRLDSKSLPIIVIQKWASAGTQDTVWLLECPKRLLKSSCSWAPTNHTAQSVAWSEQLTWELSGDNEPEMSFAGNSLSMLVIWSQWETQLHCPHGYAWKTAKIESSSLPSRAFLEVCWVSICCCWEYLCCSETANW